MTFLIGRGRYKSAVYPTANQSNIALQNRYLVDSVPGIPSAFTFTSPALHIVAAVNVTRRASGIFQVNLQTSALSSGIDTTQWAAIARSESVASGGVPYGDWLIDTGAAISTTAPSLETLMAIDGGPVGAGEEQTITLVGVNSTPFPAGNSAIIITATTLSGSTLTPGILLASAYELP